MKILHVFDHSIPLHSGYSFRSQSILNEQRRLGWQTCHVTSVKHAMEAVGGLFEGIEEIDGLEFHRTRRLPGWVEKMPLINQLAGVDVLRRRINKIVELEKPDLIHAHSPALNGLAALAAGRRAGCPVVYEIRAFWEDAAVDLGTTHENSLRYRLGRALETHVVRHADAITTICEGLRNELIEVRGLEMSKLTVIPNAVDIDRFARAPEQGRDLRRELGLADGFILGFIGSFYAYEGLDLLIDCFARIVGAYPETRLLLVGGGPEEDRLRRRVKDRGLTGRVVFTGRVPHGDVALYYDVMDALVYPRRPIRLTELVTPLKPLEAMARGGLVIASDVGGHKELIDDQRTGLLFRAGESDSLFEIATRVIDSPDNYSYMREAGRQFVREQRSWAASVARYRAVYAGLTGIGL